MPHELTIATYNVFDANPNGRAILDVIEETGAQIVAAQEVTSRDVYHLEKAGYTFEGVTEFLSPLKTAFQGIVTKLPILEVRRSQHPPPGRRGLLGWLLGWRELEHTISTVVDVHGKPVNFITIHNSFAVSVHRRRMETIRALRGHMRPDMPNIVMGDFNGYAGSKAAYLTWWITGIRFRELRLNENVAFKRMARIRGLKPVVENVVTYPLSLTHLDHIFIPKDMDFKDAYVLKKQFGSDHKAVVATLILP